MTQCFQVRDGALPLSLALLVLSLTAAPTWAEESFEPSSYSWESAEQTYAKVCSYCHDTTIGPVLHGRNLPAAYYVTIVRNGLRAMPPFREAEISDSALQGLAEYLANSEAPEGAELPAGRALAPDAEG